MNQILVNENEEIKKGKSDVCLTLGFDNDPIHVWNGHICPKMDSFLFDNVANLSRTQRNSLVYSVAIWPNTCLLRCIYSLQFEKKVLQSVKSKIKHSKIKKRNIWIPLSVLSDLKP